MNKKFHDTSSKKCGFTLIELIVVIAMISILAAIITPGYISYIDKQKVKECQTNQDTLVLHLDSARIENPKITMQELLNNTSDIKCPSGGKYQAQGSDGVSCNHQGHGEAEAVAQDTGEKNYDTSKPQLPQ